MGVGIGGDQIRDGGLDEVDLADAVKNKLIPDPSSIPDGYVLTRDENSTGKRKWAAAGGGSADIWRLSPADKPPDSANAKDDEFTGSSLDAKWSWINQGNSTATIQGKKLKLVPEYNASLNSRSIVQSAPSGEFTVACKFGLTCPVINYAILGLVFVSSGGKQIIWGPQVTTGGTVLKVLKLNSATQYNTQSQFNTLRTPWNDGSIPDLYLKAAVSRTNSLITFYISVNGYDWVQVATEAFSAHLGDVDKIGLSALHETTSSSEVVCRFEWFRVDWTPDY